MTAATSSHYSLETQRKIHATLKPAREVVQGLTTEDLRGLVSAMQRLNEHRSGLELNLSESVLALSRALNEITWPKLPIEQYAANLVPALSSLSARISAVSVEWDRVSPDLLPPNLRAFAATPGHREYLKEVLLNEALPLAYAMSEETVASVLSEPTPGARRDRIWSRRAGILSTCEERLGAIRAKQLQHKADLAWQALQAFRADLHGPAQAQAITIIDTHFTMDAPLEIEKLVTGARTPHRKLRRLAERAFAVHAPIAAIFSRDFSGKGHKYGRAREIEPWNLSRQATVHGAGRRQYTKRNALLSIAMVTSLICLLEDEHSRAAFSRS